MNDRVFASVLIPTRNPGQQISRVLESVLAQRVEFEFEIVIVDSGSSQADVHVMRSFPVQFHQIASAEFGHGRTRNFLASISSGTLLLYLSQDAEPVNPNWMSALVRPLADPLVAGAYARQIPRTDADPFIRFFLAHTYGSTPAKRKLPAGERVSIDDIFFSNVSSVVRRRVWEQYPFRSDIVMSEDQYWAYDVLCAGYQVMYYPEAQVYHSHNYSLRGLFERNWISGASLRGLIADSPTNVAKRGMQYVAEQAAYLVQNGRAQWLPYMLVYEATKALGFSMGMRFGQQRI